LLVVTGIPLFVFDPNQSHPSIPMSLLRWGQLACSLFWRRPTSQPASHIGSNDWVLAVDLKDGDEGGRVQRM